MKVADFCKSICSGGTPLRSEASYWENGNIPWLKTGEIKKEYIYSTEESISELGLNNSSAKLVPKNSILVAMYGDGDTAGHVAVNKINLTTNQACCNLTIDENKAHYRYIYFLFKGNYQNLINLKLGGSQQNLNAATIKNIDFKLPTLPIQHKIAAMLSAYDELIENNNRSIAILEKMAEELYREWFVRLRFPGHEKVKIVKGVPEGWELKAFALVVDLNPTEQVDKSELRPYVGMEDLSLTSMFFTSKEERFGNSGSKFKNRDVLFPRITPSLENGKRGFVMTLENDQVALGSTEFIVCREKHISAEHIYFLTCSSDFRKHAELSMVGASGRQRVSENCFEFFLVKVPPDTIREKFSDMVKPMFDEIAILAKRIRNMEQSRNKLLSRLMSGKINVEKMDIRFPESMKEEVANA